MNPTHNDKAVEPYPYDTALVSEILKRKRKVRGIKACFPCRHRKVRCDGKLPCSSCVERNHAELCCMPTSNTDGSQERAVRRPRLQPRPNPSMLLEYGYSINSSPREGDDYFHGPATASPTSAAPSPSIATGNNGNMDAIIRRLEKMERDISALKADLIQQSRGYVDPAGASSSNLRSGSIPAMNDLTPRDPQHPAQVKSPGKHFVEDSTGATIYLGSHSDNPLALGCRQAGENVLGGVVLDQLMPRAYPFTDLWRPVVSAEEICQTLPVDSDIIRYWQIYQAYVYPFYPALVTLDQFNQSLFQFLDQRSAIDSGGFSFEEVDLSWLALLFAMLALGAQFSDDPVNERDLRSKVFICSSFQCLRLSNMLNNTDFNQIQAMALIGHCLRNNLDTNSAWVLMGATIRLAQSIGLHEETASAQSSEFTSSEQFLRKRFWWMLAWQDTILSFTYDRPPISTNASCPIPYYSDSSPSGEPNHSFAESVFTLCQIIQERAINVRSGTTLTPQENLHMTLAYKRRFEAVFDTAAPFLTERSLCRTLKEHLERLALHIHVGYGVCRLGQFCLEDAHADVEGYQEMRESLARDCAWRAIEAVESFLDMHRLSAQVCRSWAFVHNAVSCAIALKSVAGAVSGERVEGLIHRLVAVLEKEEKESEWIDADTNKRWYGPYSRVVKALKETYGAALGYDSRPTPLSSE
ncbi:hypothetical protein GQ43DRAFT_477145 [Delitschia confertaspora ATCC 74209]|uniref:Zn(2)-C6 fungal-type domain-containing protein n=1 Tax=Delitschia confertaspora ATCC 74209 TaxID=1513339 RepID=A0A9P4JUF1_9PLEO|nr:hypothetical protein GQ43DRAFT_477145 [Delitschia confertaspora ATCC 74209]